jgi:hypothetical protein
MFLYVVMYAQNCYLSTRLWSVEMTEESITSRNSDAVSEFKKWQDGVRESLNQIASTFMEQQKQMIAEVIADQAIDFRVKLQLLEKHVGQELRLDKAAGLSSEQYQEWMYGKGKLSHAQQCVILVLLNTTILEWFECRYALEQIIGMLGRSSLWGQDEPSVLMPKKVHVSATQADQSSRLRKTFATSISGLNLPVRIERCLQNEGIEYVGHLVNYTEDDFLHIPGFGRMSLNLIKEILSSVGIRLGMSINHYPELNEFFKEHPHPHRRPE